MKYLTIIILMITFLAATAASVDDKVKISVYYESLCPDSKRFINDQLSKAFNEVNQITNIELIPFGKANYTRVPQTNLWKFQCQHGDDECYGNMIHNCFIDAYPKVDDHFRFLNCCMSNISITTTGIARECAKQLNLNIDSIINCANGDRGNELLYNMGNKTLSLQPKLFYVPWINLNDVHTNETQQEAEKVDLVGLICRTYKGNVNVKACNKAMNVSFNLIMVAFSLLTAFLLIKQ